MTYGYIYVAQIALGANMAQAVKAIAEAEAYPGPSIIIGTSKAGKMDKYQEFLANETRYSRLSRAFPDRAKALFDKNQEAAEARYTHLTKLVDLYK